MASHCVFCKTTKKTKQEQAAEDLALQKFSSLAAKSKEDRVEKTEKKPLTAEDKAKIREAALKIASVMQEDNPAESPGVQREMASGAPGSTSLVPAGMHSGAGATPPGEVSPRHVIWGSDVRRMEVLSSLPGEWAQS
eukprot:3111968-Rhodomonas_salina.1